MKLGTLKHGPVVLSGVEFFSRMSEETLAFEATLTVNGRSALVRNDGQGGATIIRDHGLSEALDTYARTLPPRVISGSSYDMDGELLVFLLVEDAVEAARVKAGRARRERLEDKCSELCTTMHMTYAEIVREVIQATGRRDPSLVNLNEPVDNVFEKYTDKEMVKIRKWLRNLSSQVQQAVATATHQSEEVEEHRCRSCGYTTCPPWCEGE